MKRTIKLTLVTNLMALTLGLAASQAVAQSNLYSRNAAIQLNATLPAQLRLSLSEINLDIKVSDPTQNSEIVSVPVTSSWALNTTTSSVELVGFFDSPAAAMSDSKGHIIPANHVLGGLSAEDMKPFVESSQVGAANSSRTFFHQRITCHNAVDKRTDTLNVQLSRIDDLGAPASEYRGTLHLRLVSY
jgi:hypothetical protein